VTRKLISIILLAVMVAALPACGTKTHERDVLLKAIARTQQLSSKFSYADERPRQSLRVSGLVEDDFRFKARVTYNGNIGYDQVVQDDTLGIRFIDPARIASLVDKRTASSATLPSDLTGITVRDALLARRWVVDTAAAPAITATGRTEATIGTDPVLDSVTALGYVSDAINQALGVKKWSKDDLEPAYASDEDQSFPKPSNGSGVERYDLVRAPLPPPGALGGAGQAATPKTSNFRKMAIYVKKGLVIKVVERVEVTGRGLDRLISYDRTFLKDQKVPDAIKTGFEQTVKQTPKAQLGAVLLAASNSFITASGATPILIRNMSLDLFDLGSKSIKVNPPVDGVVHGKLLFLISAQKPASIEAGATGTVTGTSTASTGGTEADSTTTTSTP
jgi:hypothetical protein